MTAGRPPTLTLTSRLLVHWTKGMDDWPHGRRMTATILIFCGACGLDYLAGFVNVNFLYLGATAFAVWCLGQRRGFAISLVGLAVATLIDHVDRTYPLMGHPSGFPTEIWNACGRMLSFGLVALMVDGLRGALALERWRASHDGLTGVLNRVAFEREMALTVSRAHARGHGLLFAYMDLDGFKEVNDRYGHSAGDRVLGAFARAADDVTRSTDLFARVGGDEFAALLVIPDHVDGALVARLIHERLSAILVATGFEVTCSMGAVVLVGKEAMVDDVVIEQADALMYEAKRAGKNAIRVARSDGLNPTLRAAYPLIQDRTLEDMLAALDVADRRQRWMERHAA